MTENTAPKPATPAPLASHGATPLTGRFAPPGDAALTHAALLLAALAVGRSTIAGVPDNAEFSALIAGLRQLGVRIEQQGDNWRVDGLGVGGLLAPDAPLALEQAPNAAPLLLGLLAPHDFSSQLHGVGPCAALLQALGGAFEHEDGVLTLHGAPQLAPLYGHAPSAGMKAALLLAALQIAGVSTIIEPVPTGDHVEKLLGEFGGAVDITSDAAGVTTISVTGLAPLTPCQVMVPGDPGLAGYPLLAGLIVPGSDLLVDNVLINPTRTGLIDTLLEMGGDIQFINQQQRGGDHIADLRVRSSRLKAVRVSADHTATMQADIAVLAVAAAYAEGETVIEGLAEAPLAAITAGLTANTITARATGDRLIITGDGTVAGGGTVRTDDDARLAMAFLLLGLASRAPVAIEQSSTIDAVFPGFVAALSAAGANVTPSIGVQP